MTVERAAFATFCDDVRQEVGNKHSLIGCYSGEMVFNSLPSTVPRLCAFVVVKTPIEQPIKKLIFRAVMNDQVIAEIAIPEEELIAMAEAVVAEGNLRYLAAQAVIALVSFKVQERSELRITVETESGLLDAGGMLIR